MAHSVFNLDNYEPTYYSEEARICDYLTEVHNIISKDAYMELFNALVKNDKKQVADILTSLYKQIKKMNKAMQEENDRNKMKIEYYEKQIEELNMQITKLKDKAKLLSAGKGENIAELEKIRELYEQGHSLSEIGRILNRDKTTVKRKLIKMGVQIRNSSDQIKNSSDAPDISDLFKSLNFGDYNSPDKT